MLGLRVFLAIAWIALMVISWRAVALLGWEGGNLFVTDFAHPWRAQFNSDFSAHLLLMAAWIFYREPRWFVGLPCAVAAVLGGGAFSLAYLLVATFRAHGDAHALLLGRHRV